LLSAAARPSTHGREAEAFYVLSGRLAFSVAGETKILVPGTFLHLEPGHAYGFVALGPDPAEVLILYAPAGLERLIAEAGIADPENAEASRQAALRSIEDAATLSRCKSLWRRLCRCRRERAEVASGLHVSRVGAPL
jgi:hypothetical protein